MNDPRAPQLIHTDTEYDGYTKSVLYEGTELYEASTETYNNGEIVLGDNRPRV